MSELEIADVGDEIARFEVAVDIVTSFFHAAEAADIFAFVIVGVWNPSDIKPRRGHALKALYLHQQRPKPKKHTLNNPRLPFPRDESHHLPILHVLHFLRESLSHSLRRDEHCRMRRNLLLRIVTPNDINIPSQQAKEKVWRKLHVAIEPEHVIRADFHRSVDEIMPIL